MIIQGTAIKGMTVSSSAAGITSDSYFNLVSLLLPGNGTNGAQNNTFLDSSTNNFTITRNGNTTQGTFSPFSFGGGTAQTDGYYSGYFDGSGDYLNKTSGTITLSGDFTLEYWMYPTSVGSYPTTYSTFNAIAVASAMYAQFALNGTTFTFSCGNGSSDGVIGSYTATLNQWQHHAIVRSGTTVTAYVNGVSVGTRTSSVAFNLTSLGIGAYTGALAGNYPFFGYISNFRVVNGTAVYTSNFAVPTTPLTNITNTSLLTCQSSQFIDNSANAFTITVNGNPQPTVVNPFGMTDWSGYFDGSGDYLSVANNAAFLLATNNFTIEFWVYPTNVSSTQSILSKGAGGYSPFLIQNSSGSGLIYISSAGSAWDVASGVSLGTIPISTWTHIAITREGNTFKTFKNGIQVSTFSSSASLYNPANPVTIGYNGGGYPEAFYGNISNLRIVNGTALYTANFTPPTAPLTAVTNTTLLTCQSSTFVDNSTNAFTITVNGNAYTGTLNNPFNSIVNYTTPPVQAWSNYFDGTGDYLNGTNASAFAFGTGDFTIECWVYSTAGSNNGVWLIASSAFPGSAGLAVAANGGQWTVYYGSTSQAHGIGSIGTGAWQHVALVRQSGSLYLYSNGVKYTVAASDTTNYTYTALVIGGYYSTSFLWNGYISNFRVVKGTAVYTANFTVPTAPLTAITNTSLLTCQSNNFVDNSINRFAITRNGDTSVQPFSPFNPDAAYSTTSVGGSGYFDGTGDSLTIPGSSAFDFGTGNFTAEAWVYPMGASSDMSMIDFWIAGGGSYVVGQWQLTLYTSDTLSFVWASGSNTAVRITSPSNTLPKNTWTHIAVTRTGNLFQIFTNGVLGASTTLTQAMGTTSSGRIGIQTVNNAAPFTGYISGARILKGTSLYTTGFVPPAAPFTAVTNTQLLLNYTNAGIPDATAKNVLETVGNAQISTAQSKFGGSSMAFDGTGDYLLAPSNHRNIEFLAGDFTIECWIRFAVVGNGQIITGLSAANTIYWQYFSSQLAFGQNNIANIAATNWSPTANTWYHIAVTRSGTTVRQFVDGVQLGSNVTSSASFANGPIQIGSGGAGALNGYIDDLRITKGYARYTTNFTPPTQAFPLL